MNVLKTLTIRNLQLNKRRTIVTIIGIVLAVALICAVAGMFQSLHQTALNDTIKNYGKYHTAFDGVKTNDLDLIKNHEYVKDTYIVNEVGYAIPVGLANEDYYGALIKIVSYDKKAIEMAPLRLTKGRLPKNSNEVVIVSGLAGNAKIGDTLTFSVGRPDDREVINIVDSFYYVSSDMDGVSHVKRDQPLIETEDIEYKVVGFIGEVWYGPYNAYGYSVITYNDTQMEDTYSDVYVIYNNAKDYAKRSDEISKAFEPELEHRYNDGYLELIGASFSDNTNKALIAVASIVIGIIMLTCIFVIKNGFAISVVERYRQFGMLSSIGATSKQIRRMVLFEGFVVGAISILFGIFVGCGAVFVLIEIINNLLHEYLTFRFDFHISMLVIYGTIIASSVTIFFACLMPAWKVSRVSPIDAIRNSNDIKIKAKKLRTPKYISKLFGIGGEISHKNLKRSKKKYRTTIVSLVVSIVIFIAISSFIEVIARSSTYYFNDNVQFDIMVQGWSNDSEESSNEFLSDAFNEISELSHIDRYSIARSTLLNVNDMSLINQRYYKDCIENEYCLGTGIQLMSLGAEEFKHYINKLGGNIEDYKRGAILIDEGLVYNEENEKYEEIKLLNISTGSMLRISYNSYDYDEENDKMVLAGEVNYDIEILRRTTTMPMSLMGFDAHHPVPTLIVSEEYFDELITTIQHWDIEMYIKSKNVDELVVLLDNYIENLDGGSVEYFNVKEEIRAVKTMILVVQIFLYGFIGVISLVGVTNIFNTITTNMALRSREFAMLKSIGMTDKEFRRMIRLESILYGLKSLLIGIPIGIGLSILIYNGMSSTMVLIYRLPMNAIIISIVFVFIIVFITMKYSLSKINKQNIIETIRSENI